MEKINAQIYRHRQKRWVLGQDQGLVVVVKVSHVLIKNKHRDTTYIFLNE
jgi:hypothetical protein